MYQHFVLCLQCIQMIPHEALLASLISAKASVQRLWAMHNMMMSCASHVLSRHTRSTSVSSVSLGTERPRLNKLFACMFCLAVTWTGWHVGLDETQQNVWILMTWGRERAARPNKWKAKHFSLLATKYKAVYDFDFVLNVLNVAKKQ